MNKKNIVFLVVALFFSGCQTNNVDKNNEAPVIDSDSKGAYYLDDGPADNLPEIFRVFQMRYPKKSL